MGQRLLVGRLPICLVLRHMIHRPSLGVSDVLGTVRGRQFLGQAKILLDSGTFLVPQAADEPGLLLALGADDSYWYL